LCRAILIKALLVDEVIEDSALEVLFSQSGGTG